MTPLKGQITISRPSTNDDRREFVRIAIKDAGSRLQFLEVEVELEPFAAALTGLSEQPCLLKTHGLTNVGKVREVERVTFVLTGDYLSRHGLSRYDKERIRDHLQADPEGIFQEEGWELSTYLGAQNSITSNHPDGIRINTTRVRYVERKAE